MCVVVKALVKYTSFHRYTTPGKFKLEHVQFSEMLAECSALQKLWRYFYRWPGYMVIQP